MLLECKSLRPIAEIRLNVADLKSSPAESTQGLSISALCAKSNESFLVGYSNGVGRSYSYETREEEGIYFPNVKPTNFQVQSSSVEEEKVAKQEEEQIEIELPQGSPTHQSQGEAPPGIVFPGIRILDQSLSDGIIVAAYDDYFKNQYNRILKLDKAKIFLFYKESGIEKGSISTTGESIMQLNVLENKKLLIFLSSENNNVYLADYMNCTMLIQMNLNLEGITDHTMVLSMCSISTTKQLVNAFRNKIENNKKNAKNKKKKDAREIVDNQIQELNPSLEKNPGDIVYFGLDNGNILSSQMKLTTKDEKLLLEFLPQNLYTSKIKKETKEDTIANLEKNLNSTRCLSIDPVSDILLAGDFGGNIKIQEKTIEQILESAQEPATSIEASAERAQIPAYKISIITQQIQLTILGMF